MTLGELIERLKKENPDNIVKLGFHSPHSYRGYYDELAFETKRDVRVGDMLAAAESSLGKEFTGYKGGEYTMGPHTDVHLAEYGNTGEPLGELLLEYMLGDVAKRPKKRSAR